MHCRRVVSLCVGTGLALGIMGVAPANAAPSCPGQVIPKSAKSQPGFGQFVRVEAQGEVPGVGDSISLFARLPRTACDS